MPSAGLDLVPVVNGLTDPVFVANARDGSNRLFIVERTGIVRVLRPGTSASTVFLDIGSKVTFADSEQGLLGLAFHPQYAGNGRFFVAYTRASDGALVISEFRVSANPDVAGTAEQVLLTIAHPSNTNHNGGMIAFGPDGHLYIGTGDGGSANDPPNNAQNINVLLGKILRIDIDHPDPVAGKPYSSPAGNPFVGVAGLDEIFALGFRNPWRFSFDRLTGQMWVGDVGQGAREEIDTPIVTGGNYGWRVYEGTACTNLDPALCGSAGYRFPLFEYGTHAGGRCAITGGYVYRGAAATLTQGTYVFGDYCSGEILYWRNGVSGPLLDTSLNVSSFGEDEAGELYVVDLGGSVFRLAATATGTPTITGPPPGSVLPGASATFGWTANGAAVTEWWLYAGSTAGAKDYYNSGSLGTSLSTTITGLPGNGAAVFVRLWFRVGGTWQWRDFQYTAAASAPTIASPAPGSVLAGTSAAFSWTANGAPVSEWWMYAGSTAGSKNYYNSGSLGTNVSTTVTGLPVNGSTVYVRLWYRIGGTWQWRDFQYTATRAPTIVNPPPGSVLTGATATFSWTANGTAVTEWWLYAGSTAGAKNYYNSGTLGTGVSTTVTGLPRNGSAVFVRLWFRIGGTWRWTDFQYTASAAS